MAVLRAPFPYFGGKSRVAAEVWNRLGDVTSYVEPFCGSAAVLLARPYHPRAETVNDLNVFISNLWRALQAEPDEVARLCDWPINEADLHARHRWLMASTASEAWRERMKHDPDYYDVKVAAYWVWGQSMWIGAGWCDGTRLVGEGNTRHGKLPVLDHAKGVHAHARQYESNKIPNLSGYGDRGVHKKLPYLDNGNRGLHSEGAAAASLSGGRRPKLTGSGEAGVHSKEPVRAWFEQLQQRLRRVRVTCGDWSRVCTPAVTSGMGLCGVFLDPPYSLEAGRDSKIYAVEDLKISHDVREWCLERGSDPLMRIALCGYEGEGHEALEAAGWRVHAWRAGGGYGNQNAGGRGKANRLRERIWFSPHCLTGQQGLFEEMEAAA